MVRGIESGGKSTNASRTIGASMGPAMVRGIESGLSQRTIAWQHASMGPAMVRGIEERDAIRSSARSHRASMGPAMVRGIE